MSLLAIILYINIGKEVFIKDEQIKRYYDLWRKGKKQDEIASVLGVSMHTLRSNASKIFLYIKDQQSLSCGNGSMLPPDYTPLTDKYRKEAIELAGLGLNYNKISDKLGIPPATLMLQWIPDNPDFALELRQASLANDVKVKKALLKRAVGGRWKKKTVEQRDALIKGKDEDKIEQLTTLRETSGIREGDIEAIRYWLDNRDPESWASGPKTGTKNNVGEILKAVDNMLDISDDMMKEFDNAVVS